MMDSRTYAGEAPEGFPTKEERRRKAPVAGWSWGAVAVIGWLVVLVVAAVVISLLNTETIGQHMMDTDSSWLWFYPLF